MQYPDYSCFLRKKNKPPPPKYCTQHLFHSVQIWHWNVKVHLLLFYSFVKQSGWNGCFLFNMWIIVPVTDRNKCWLPADHLFTFKTVGKFTIHKDNFLTWLGTVNGKVYSVRKMENNTSSYYFCLLGFVKYNFIDWELLFAFQLGFPWMVISAWPTIFFYCFVLFSLQG